MRYNEVFGGAVVKEGYTMVMLMNEGISWHAIIYRNKVDDFVFCSNYDIKDGTWGQGHYCQTYTGALSAMAEYLGI